MSRRRLTRRQAWRIEKVQQERLRRAQQKAACLEGQLGADGLGPEQTGLVIANYGPAIDVEDSEGAVYRCLFRQNLETLVVGDRVVWQAGREFTGVVVALAPRHSLLARPDDRGQLKPLAANIDQILVVVAPLPAYSTESIDQYLVAAETTGISPVILFNKIDLLDEAEWRHLTPDIEHYRAIGYQVIYASTVARHGLDELRAGLRDRTSVFVGQSGVGKSSLVKALLPAAEIAVGELSAGTGLGRHTTSVSRLYHHPGGGDIIDSPGVREFRLWDMDRTQLAAGFVEFRPFLVRCRFRNCRHLEEPGCALHEAVEQGRISRQRLESFRRIAAILEEQQASR